MRKIIAITQLTVDGAMQAPGSSEEDRRRGFTYGGWAMPLVDDSLDIVETVAEYDLLLGRTTYDIFAGYWPFQDNESERRSAGRRNTLSRTAPITSAGIPRYR